jgi:hypothetical protein
LLRKAFEDTLRILSSSRTRKPKLNVDLVPADVIEKDISALFSLILDGR